VAARKGNEEILVGRRRVPLTNPDKVLFPDVGVTKSDLVTYYRDVAGVMVPHIRGHPLMLQRCPDGIRGECFYQKHASAYFPDWIATVDAPKEGGVVHHVVCNDEATLAYLAGQACIGFHSWLSRADRLERPDRIIFDFDPSGHDFDDVRSGAKSTARLLEQLGLEPFVATTGSRGLHVVAPIERRSSFDEVRAFARRAAELLAAADPEHLTVEARKQARRGRVLIDIMRNGYAQTAIAPYSVRVLPGAPVATPLSWPELDDRRLGPQRFGVANVRQRLAAHGDPWSVMASHARSLAGARRLLEELAPATARAG
jgi:bifunctional non-homologous end joining protein LigD